jgi:hypothetical protein
MYGVRGEFMTIAQEKHYSVQEIAEMWGLSSEKVRKMFQDVPGVLKLGFSSTSKKGRKPYITLRIPASVLARFHQDWSRGFGPEVQGGRRAV